MTEKQINMSIVDGDAFYAHELSLNYNPTQFVFDFKNVTPRIDPRNQDGASLVMKHNVILSDPFHTKKMLELLGEVIKKYEAEYGKIDKPAAIKKYEKKQNDTKDKIKDKTQAPSYLG